MNEQKKGVSAEIQKIEKKNLKLTERKNSLDGLKKGGDIE